MKKLYLLIGGIFSAVLFMGAGCADTTPTNTTTIQTDSVVVEQVTNETDEEASEEVAIEYAPGETPYDYPTVSTTANEGEYVLAPSRTFVDSALEAEDDSSTSMIFYDATVVEVGDVESVLDDKFDEVTMPNSLIIPIPAGETAATGDVVLSWWQSGSGMQRSYVVDGTNGSTPVVRYLDLDLDNPAKNADGTPIAEAEETLEANSFVVLNTEYQPGTAVAVQNGSSLGSHYQVVNEADGTLLVMGWAGIMSVVDKADVLPLPIKPTVAAGDAVYFPLFGTMDEGTVTSVDNATGRVFVEYEFAGSMEEAGIAFGDVIPVADVQ